MERSSSQLENMRPSGIKPPSRLPAMASTVAARTLAEASQSSLNARNGTSDGSIMGPPSGIPSKHKPSGLPEPPTKRKTLIERAAEPLHPPRSHLPAVNRLQPSSGHARTKSQPTSGPRKASNISLASAVAKSGARPASQQNAIAAQKREQVPSGLEDDLDVDSSGVMGKRKAWDTNGRLHDMEAMYIELRTQFASAAETKNTMEETLSAYKMQIEDLKQANRELSSENKNLSSDLDRAKNDLHATAIDMRQAKRDHERDLLDMECKTERSISDIQRQHEKDVSRLEREREKAGDAHEREIERLKKDWQQQRDVEVDTMRKRQIEEMSQMQSNHDSTLATLQLELDTSRRSDEGRAAESATQAEALRHTISSLQSQLEIANSTMVSLRSQNSAAESRNAALEQDKAALISKTHFLEGNQEAQSLEFTTMSDQLRHAVEAKEATLETLRREEMLRRKLNATILELKGNIRVFVRTRPLLDGEADPSRVEYPDSDALEGGRELVVHAPTSFSVTGKERNEKHNYAFDRVFGPGLDNLAVFEDCRDLIQSVIDGYNVSILSYGQTGSGKTFGMSGVNGVIPSSINILLSEIRRLKTKGWEYAVEASFVEVYNETLNDLLGDAKTWDEGDGDTNTNGKNKRKEKHEIHHDAMNGKTTVTNLTSTQLWPPQEKIVSQETSTDSAGNEDDDSAVAASAYMQRTIDNLLDTAARNRRVAATKANERSSRSHSIFMLNLKGRCTATNESSEGVLNLVDLAGSERLKQSGAEGSRKLETAAINKSLSSLGDVIAALGSKGGVNDAHVPYRNSKLTYLLQNSLGGKAANGKSSRTLMLLHLSPLAAHWQESRSSLLFGAKVHGTHIGTAKKR
ncbi:kinesin-domain-containing protein [Polychaeton citri CBS 116435]|uniref:Kinesin-like protein n=1 Tax=Polychaeton citri CBS 116435 TaxID=1314669 RepID=A0A9P4Q3C3_9PEZI|nr:kinesin-domain-containing protein [Polychaeton citri CBS 116435]